MMGSRFAVRLQRAGFGIEPVTWSDLARLVERERPSTLSVDIFDTCIVRRLLGDQPIELAIDRQATRPGPGRDGRAGELETLLCQAVPGAELALERVRAAGTKVVFMSDTDRSSETLVQILTDAGLFIAGDRLFASCEQGASKVEGDLFTQTWPDLDADEVWHVGNSSWSDVVMPAKAGLRSYPLQAADPSRYEAVMAARPETAGPAIAAAARMARLSATIAGSHGPMASGTQLEVLGGQVAGQAFTAFLLWLAEQSRNEGLQHLSFLSRDGELLLDMARAMPRDHWTGIDLGYLYCSRWSWLLTGAASYGVDQWLEAGTKDDTSFVHGNRHRVPFESLLGRIGLEIDDISGHAGVRDLDLRRPLPLSMAPAWIALLEDRSIQKKILKRATTRRDLILAYLSSLGLPRQPVGLVDVGWRGRLAWSMSPVLAEVTEHEPMHLHFGGDKVLADANLAVDIKRFAFDGLSSPYPIESPVACVETLTASGGPRVVGYRRVGDVAEPVLDRRVPAVDTADRRRMWSGAVRVATEMPSRAVLDTVGVSCDHLADEARDVLACWWVDPVRNEVEAMRGLAFETDDDGQAIKPLVRAYSPTEFAGRGGRGRIWQQGSSALSSKPMSAAVSLYRRFRR